jgi:hypothetical protein
MLKFKSRMFLQLAVLMLSQFCMEFTLYLNKIMHWPVIFILFSYKNGL